MRHLEGFTFDVDGGLWARGGILDATTAANWIAWHFTPIVNLPRIKADGGLLPHSAASPAASAGDDGIKGRRLLRRVPLGHYPESCVGDHVPLYIAGKSPMLHRVAKYGAGTYDGGSRGLVMLGFRVGLIAGSGHYWCATDSNAVSATAQFTENIDEVPALVDFDLLTSKWWNNTLEDPNRASRRSAEILVHDFLPLDWLEVVVVSNESTRRQVEESLRGTQYVGPLVVPTMFP